MNESVGYTVTINIIITFIVIVFVFLSNVLIYYKSNKVGNLIVDSIEKYSGFNNLSKNEIDANLNSIGYNKTKINCPKFVEEKNSTNCPLVDKFGENEIDTSNQGYCVYVCQDSGSEYYYYKVKANMIINIPIINNLIHGSVFFATRSIYDFEEGVDLPENNTDTNQSPENIEIEEEVDGGSS